MPSHTGLLDELSWRGLLYQYTEGLAESLATSAVTAYCGFDPTAPSLHAGNLVPVMGLVHLQRAGHRPIALVGGGTGMIGDPSGKSAERPLLAAGEIEENVRLIRSQLEHFLDFSGPTAARMRNNSEWLLPLRAVDFMRDVGKHFSVNYMMAKESVKARLEQGLSYTEFSYMLLQAYDFLELFRREGATLQIGGSDQWGNITAGVELIRRVAGREAHALTFPLFTTASGAKFGKTESGSVWLDSSRTSPYQFYQFWINTDDRDAGKYLRLLSLLTREQIEELERDLAARPERRAAQQALARDVTARVHGPDAARIAAEVSALLFGGGDATQLSTEALEALTREIPFYEYAPSMSPERATSAKNEQSGVDVVDLIAASKLAPSKSAARRLLQQGGVYVNGVKQSDAFITRDRLLPGGRLLLRKGAREYALVRVRTRGG